MEPKPKIDPITGRPILTFSIVEENEHLANMAPDSTKDFSKRPNTWKPPLVSPEDHCIENPYNH